MAVLKIAKLGNPVLRKKAQPVDLEELKKPDSSIQNFIEDMVDTMRQEGGVGLAAPQVSQSVQIIVLESAGNKRYPDRPSLPLTVLVNPEIIHCSEDRQEGWESCLSLIDFRGLVSRYRQVTVKAYHRNGEQVVIEAEGFMAVVLQHEIDHLNGIVFIDRMTDFTNLSYQEEFEIYWTEGGVVEA